jgi:Family of unknown function (DUF6476)
MDDRPLDPAAERIVAKVRRLMALSVLFTGIAVAAVLGVIGYRVFRGEGSATPTADVSVSLPRGAKVIATALNEDRLAVTIEVGGQTEVHLFDTRTLAPRGRLRLRVEP